MTELSPMAARAPEPEAVHVAEVARLRRNRRTNVHHPGVREPALQRDHLAIGETCHSSDIPSPSLWIHLLKGEGGTAE